MPISTMKATFAASPSKIWRIVTDNRNFQWRSDLSRIDLADDELHFTEYTKTGFPTTFTITYKEPYKRYEFKLKNENMSGRWTGIFTPAGAGTEVELIEDITVKNPVMRLLAGIYLKKQQKTYIKDLQKALKETK